jgi:putative PIN family toxin of toxin-antitoxin system
MIVVLDTNIIVSALLSTSGPPAEIMRRWEADEFSGITSPPILDELAHVINYPKITNLLDLSHEEIYAFTDRMSAVATVIEPKIHLDIVQNDIEDNRILECATAGEADYIVTGDNHLLKLKEWKVIKGRFKAITPI